MQSLGSIPQDFALGNVWEVELGTTLPAAIVGRRAQYDELIWDADGGFAPNWVANSSLGGDSTAGYVVLLQRTAYSGAGLALFAHSAGGGGGSGNATSILGEAVPALAAGALTYNGTDLVWTTPGGSGDVVGPAGATSDRIAVFNGTTGKLVKDGGKTIAQVLADAATAAAAGDVTTLAAAKTYTDAAVAPISCSYAIRGTAPMTLSCSALGVWADYSSLSYSGLSLATITSHAKLVKSAGNSSVFTITDAGTYFVSGWLSIAGSGNLFAMGVRVGGTVVLSSLSWAGSATSGDFNARVGGVVTVGAGATLSVDWILESSTGSFGLNSGVAAFNQAWLGGIVIYKL